MGVSNCKIFPACFARAAIWNPSGSATDTMHFTIIIRYLTFVTSHSVKRGLSLPSRGSLSMSPFDCSPSRSALCSLSVSSSSTPRGSVGILITSGKLQLRQIQQTNIWFNLYYASVKSRESWYLVRTRPGLFCMNLWRTSDQYTFYSQKKKKADIKWLCHMSWMRGKTEHHYPCMNCLSDCLRLIITTRQPSHEIMMR